MIGKTIKYVDFNGTEREEVFYFNFSEAECAEMELTVNGGLSTMMAKIVAEKDMPNIFRLFKQFILKAYGEKSPDGKRFIKSEEISNSFYQTNAYNQLFMDLTSDDGTKIAEFFNKVLPSNLEEYTKRVEAGAIATPQLVQ